MGKHDSGETSKPKDGYEPKHEKPIEIRTPAEQAAWINEIREGKK